MAKDGQIPLQVLMGYFRVPTGDLAVDYPGRELLLGSRITNVSKNGVFIRTAKPLPLGTELDIVFRLPSGSADIQARTVVRWCHKPERKRAHEAGMGVEFKEIGRKEKKAIEKYVKEFLERMRKGK